MTAAERRTFVESLARDNRRFYGTPDGRATLRAFELSFEHRWIYVFELVQNALDAGARSIAFRQANDGDRLTFQHDGQSALGEPEVEGLSKVFRSTKGAATVGFMGIGFKSVFGRFREAQVSGWGWTFRYEIPVIIGQTYGDVQTDPLGAVIPIWDDRIPDPEADFTTRFELSGRVDEDMDLRSDLAGLLPERDPTLLAIMAASNLKYLEVDGRAWDLDIDETPDGATCTASECAGGPVLQWRLFAVEFEPSRDAIRRFIERRKIRPADADREWVYAEAARPRRVLGVLPLDEQGVPAPPRRGRIYATLPTEVTLPFGLHVNADWLLNISRTGLGEVEDDPWQRDIADRIADLLASFLGWVARTFSDPDTVQVALGALRAPTPESRGLEEILAEPRWLSRLESQLNDAAVIPVWTGESNRLSFATPHETVVPPAPLAEAFEQQPALRPPALLKGPVLARHVLGSGGRALMESTGLLAEMSQGDLERRWADGLEHWWSGLDDEEPARRDMLFRLWAAISRLPSETAWSIVSFRCVRTADGKWRSVDESTFFDEPPPSEREPGGGETRQFILRPVACETFIAHAWIMALRRGAGREREHAELGYLSLARRWVESSARRVGLRSLVEDAVKALEAAPTPDGSVFVPLGRWALHRNRPDLLARVLVDSENGQCGVPTNGALLSEPYIRGQNRKILFPDMPVISAAYLAGIETPDPHEWRGFFQKAGVKGALEVRAVERHARRRQRKRVAAFLGRELQEYEDSNNAGYTLRDFDVFTGLPDPEASTETRTAVAAWLEDGFSAFRGRGRRQVQYFYMSERSPITATRPSAWAVKLSKLAWVPCDKGELMRPRDVLPRPDPARQGEPVANLSDDLLSVLEQEGVRFGGEIPEATALRRLLTTGSQLPAEELATLLREVREEISTDEDRRHFEHAVVQLQVPTVDDGRVQLDRIVQRVGGSQLRGTLGGRIAPLDRFDKQLIEELEHNAFPYEIPETTTGEQALDYIRDVWRRAQSSPARLANEVRDVLPSAYAYCLKDCADDPSLLSRWEAAVPEAVVFVGGEWTVLAGAENIYCDDVDDRRFIPDTAKLRTVTAGHLGHSPSDQRRAAQALGLPLLSSAVTMEWSGENGQPVAGDWALRFDLICKLLRFVRGGSERAQGETEANPADVDLRQSRDLALKVGVAGGSAEWVPVNARLREKETVLTVAGRPSQFGADAAKELLRSLAFRQRGDLAADLTGMLMAIDIDEDFRLAAEKFRRSFVPDFVQPPPVQTNPPDEDDGKAAETEDPPGTSDDVRSVPERQKVTEQSGPQATSSGRHRKADPSRSESRSDKPASGDSVEPESSRSSFTRDRALARQNAVAKALRTLKSTLKGEMAPTGDEEEADEREKGAASGDGLLGDEAYRRIAAQYERAFGRNPEIGSPSQTGWDLRSVDPRTGAERLIEVKGKGCVWMQDQVVELSRAQVHKAFEMLGARTPGSSSWYLYVVERMQDGDFQVLPIDNPVHVAGAWILAGESWREIAVEPRRITIAEDGDQQP